MQFEFYYLCAQWLTWRQWNAHFENSGDETALQFGNILCLATFHSISNQICSVSVNDKVIQFIAPHAGSVLHTASLNKRVDAYELWVENYFMHTLDPQKLEKYCSWPFPSENSIQLVRDMKSN